MSKSVCVIGAGPSGITAAKNLLDQGLAVTVFEQSSEVGGNWVFSDKPGHSSVFETTHIISSKTLSQYDDYPMPSDYPDYPSHQQLAAYFQGYARRFDLYKIIQFQTKVLHCELSENGKWKVDIQHKETFQTLYFDALAICNGHHWNPRMPQYPGSFSGRLMHSHEVKRFSDFTGVDSLGAMVVSALVFMLFQYLERDHTLEESWLCHNFWFCPYNKRKVVDDDVVEVAEKVVAVEKEGGKDVDPVEKDAPQDATNVASE